MSITDMIREAVTEVTEHDGWTIVRNRITGRSAAAQTFPNGAVAELSYSRNVDETELLAQVAATVSIVK